MHTQPFTSFSPFRPGLKLAESTDPTADPPDGGGGSGGGTGSGSGTSPSQPEPEEEEEPPQ